MNIQEIQGLLNDAALHLRYNPAHADLASTCNDAAITVGQLGRSHDALLAACREMLCYFADSRAGSEQAIDRVRAAIAQAAGNASPAPVVSGNLNEPLTGKE